MSGHTVLTFDLVVATVDRVDELGGLLGSLEQQTHTAFRALIVDQNEDDRLEPLLAGHSSLDVVRLRSSRGLSRARNVALRHIEADLVVFPDDDCLFPQDLLARVAQRFATEPTLDGLTGRVADEGRHSSSSWKRDAITLSRENLWNRASSATIFLRRTVVQQLGDFDNELGLGSGNPWESGEEIDYLVRAVDTGARIEYDPSLVVTHRGPPDSPGALQELGSREGASVGYILRKHGFPPRTVTRMYARPLGGVLLALGQGNLPRARFHLSTLRGRLLGYRVLMARLWRPRRVAAGIGRRVPLRPFRIFFPYALWRPLFRLWLGTLRAQADRTKAMRQLLQVYQDAYVGVDRGAIDYDGGVHAKHRLTGYHDFFIERINRDERVLDVGCGKGELAYDIAERAGATVVAVDVSPWMLEFARARFGHARVTYVQADAVGYTPDAPVDVAVLSNVLEHITPRLELLQALRAATGARRLLIRVPMLERDWTVPLRREVGLPHFSDPEHKVEYDPQLLRDELAEAGWLMGEPQLVWGEIWVEASTH